LGGRFDARGEGAVGEAGVEEVAGSELRGGADEGAIGIEDKGVSAVEDGERGERVEARVERAEAGGGGVDEALGRAVEMGAAGEEALACLGKGLARIVAEDEGCELGNVGLTNADSVVESGVEALGKVVDALGGAMEEC